MTWRMECGCQRVWYAKYQGFRCSHCLAPVKSTRVTEEEEMHVHEREFEQWCEDLEQEEMWKNGQRVIPPQGNALFRDGDLVVDHVMSLQTPITEDEDWYVQFVSKWASEDLRLYPNPIDQKATSVEIPMEARPCGGEYGAIAQATAWSSRRLAALKQEAQKTLQRTLIKAPTCPCCGEVAELRWEDRDFSSTARWQCPELEPRNPKEELPW